jgi:hypothetical protein
LKKDPSDPNLNRGHASSRREARWCDGGATSIVFCL